MVRHLGALGDGVGLVLGGPPSRLLAASPPVVFLQSLLDACLLFFLFFFLLHAVGGGASRAVRAAFLLGVGVGGGGDSDSGLGRGHFIGGLLLRLDVDGGFGGGILDVLARGRRGRGPGRALEGHQRVERPRPPLLDSLFPRANLPGEHLRVPEDDLVYLRLVGVAVFGLDRGDDVVLVKPDSLGLASVHRAQGLDARLRQPLALRLLLATLLPELVVRGMGVLLRGHPHGRVAFLVENRGSFHGSFHVIRRVNGGNAGLHHRCGRERRHGLGQCVSAAANVLSLGFFETRWRASRWSEKRACVNKSVPMRRAGTWWSVRDVNALSSFYIRDRGGAFASGPPRRFA
mmetsp:Transcript_8577/g.39006  ORF Transcript_8577/g.39006 Transcript_8577/m.39006 type:complete len:346 (-) Transcript_8577:47-1084(-)